SHRVDCLEIDSTVWLHSVWGEQPICFASNVRNLLAKGPNSIELRRRAGLENIAGGREVVLVGGHGLSQRHEIVFKALHHLQNRLCRIGSCGSGRLCRYEATAKESNGAT